MSTLVEGPVDADTGNISFNRAEGINLPLRERDKATGAWVDISQKERFFNIGGGTFRKALDPDPANPTGRRLILTVEDLRIVNPTQQFSLTDEDGTVPISLWEGLIYERTN